VRRLAVLAALAGPAAAQELSITPPSRPATLATDAPAVPATAATGVVTAAGGVLRVLDKIDGTVADLDLAPGETADVGSLTVTLGECRYPAANPAGDAFALVSIRTQADETAVFEGWLVASAPALSAVDHPRYDVWALRCRGT
jgi:hypothetical protein